MRGYLLAAILGAFLFMPGGTRADTVFTAGEWRVCFAPTNATLTLTHADSGTELKGILAFAGPDRAVDANAAPTNLWSVCEARDGVANRLVLVDRNQDAQGYVVFRAAGPRIALLFHHRTALAFQGGLLYAGRVRYRADAFACRTRAQRGERVLALKDGDAHSTLDDALFSTAADEALRFSAANLALSDAAPGVWDFTLSGAITEPAEAVFAVEVARDYYRSRWVPYYRPLDRRRAPRPPTGWMSWNIYFDRAGSRENLAEARLGAKWLKPFGLEYWSIESWQGNSPKLPVSNFHNMDLETSAEKFPEGMKWLAGEIRRLGFRPGLWMAPFGTGNGAFYAAHRDWFLHAADGQPIRCWNGKYTLDPTAADALEHLRRIFDVASHDWGYEFFKIDGMSGRGPGYCAHLYERSEIRARFRDPTCTNAFARCCRAFRAGIGEDRVFLACQGHYTGPEAAYADAARTGADIVHPNQPVRWENLLLQARCTINQNFVNGIVFWNDPDCLMISEKALADEQARVAATVVALPGQQMFSGDKLGELAPERIRMLQQVLPVANVRPGALYPMFGHLPVWDLHVQRPWGDWHVVALFNWNDVPMPVGFDWSEIGERESRAFVCWEFWTETWQGVCTDHFEMRVPPRSVRLLALQPVQTHPHFLSTDRHVTQGAVSWKGDRWDPAARRLVTTHAAVGGFAQTIHVGVPMRLRADSVRVPAGVSARSVPSAGGSVFSVTFKAEMDGEVPVEILFSEK